MGLCDEEWFVREKIWCLCGWGALPFPKTREGDFPTKDNKGLASNVRLLVYFLWAPYTPAPLLLPLKSRDFGNHKLSWFSGWFSFYQLQDEEHALAYRSKKSVCYTIYYRRLRLLWDQLSMRDSFQTKIGAHTPIDSKGSCREEFHLT